FNSPFGACPACNGLGVRKEFDLDLILPDRDLTLRQEGIAPLGKPRSNWWWSQVDAIARAYDFDYDTPIKDIPKEALDVLLYGSGKQKYEILYTHPNGKSVTYHQTISGIFESLQHYYETTTSSGIREWAESFMNTLPCEACRGGRLREESLAVRFHDKNIADIARMSVLDAHAFFETLELTGRERLIGEQILKEIRSRLTFLLDVGLGYLTLDRSARSLSGGEAQRIRLATQIGTQLVGVMYILDEPSIGLHQRDNHRLIQSLKDLRDLGNTVIVVEHDRDMITSADYIIDLGPGAGEHGGHMIKTGTPRQFLRKNSHKEKTGGTPQYALNGSLTAEYISGKRRIEPPLERRPGNGHALVLEGARGNNLKDVTLSIPLGTFTCITGVSGSGKSSLINETLYLALGKRLMHMKAVPLPYRQIRGLEHVDKVIDIDQTPIGRTPRSNPATYTGVFTHIRDLFASLPESKIRGYKPGRFSFNVSEGSCDACKGDGVRKIEMNFLPDVYVVCDVCNGRRYDRETLAVHFHGKSINDVLNMTVEEAREFFSEIHPIRRKLDTLYDVGLGYIRLGQRATTLSGGEAQRVKLATELSKISTGKTMYILDEPTTGLHFEDVRMLLSVLNRLVDRGNTVIVIEHNLEVIKCADWIVDLGPEGGDEGGYIVAQGTPEAILQSRKSYTAEFLRAELMPQQTKRKASNA
ncbi:MAG: excinuclease ABC subunit UvrA, partial [Chlorobi bacterium]|nr:excinuclease ABC subunit UvrA [Chlorobiota bacterium]